jgi:hypothetical protein
MVWVAAGLADASLRGQVVLEILAIRERPLKGLIERPVGFHFLVDGSIGGRIRRHRGNR